MLNQYIDYIINELPHQIVYNITSFFYHILVYFFSLPLYVKILIFTFLCLISLFILRSLYKTYISGDYYF